MSRARELSLGDINENFKEAARECGQLILDLPDIGEDEKDSCRECGRYFVPSYPNTTRRCWVCQGK